MTTRGGRLCARTRPGSAFTPEPRVNLDALLKYHEKSGFYLDAAGPNLATLPAGWKNRLIEVERNRLRAWFLEPNDAAVSKYARGEPRDIRWIRAGMRAGVVSLPIVQARMRNTTFIDHEEQQKAKALVEADRAWVKSLR